MRLEHYPLEKLKQELLAVLGRHIDLVHYRIFFFGSRVAGKGTERSDIDIGIEGQTPIPQGVMGDIEEEIEALPILYKIDIVDFLRVTDKFRRVAKQHIEYFA